jgi:hypothetical protein
MGTHLPGTYIYIGEGSGDEYISLQRDHLEKLGVRLPGNLQVVERGLSNHSIFLYNRSSVRGTWRSALLGKMKDM